MGQAVRNGLGSVVDHPQLRVEGPDLFRVDGVNLYDMELDLFLQNLQGGLHAEVFSCDGGQGAYK